jgi:glutaredoxin
MFKNSPNCEDIINIILIIIIIIIASNIIYKKFLPDTLIDVKPLDFKTRFKDADIIVIKSNNCGYCHKLMKELNQNGLSDSLKVIDVSTKEGSKLLQDSGETGVPVILSNKTGLKHVGYTNDFNKLLEKLKC